MAQIVESKCKCVAPQRPALRMNESYVLWLVFAMTKTTDMCTDRETICTIYPHKFDPFRAGGRFMEWQKSYAQFVCRYNTLATRLAPLETTKLCVPLDVCFHSGRPRLWCHVGEVSPVRNFRQVVFEGGAHELLCRRRIVLPGRRRLHHDTGFFFEVVVGFPPIIRVRVLWLVIRV